MISKSNALGTRIHGSALTMIVWRNFDFSTYRVIIMGENSAYIWQTLSTLQKGAYGWIDRITALLGKPSQR